MKTNTLLSTAIGFLATVNDVRGFLSNPSKRATVLPSPSTRLRATGEDGGSGDDSPEAMQKKAEELREQIRKMEESLGDSRPRNYDMPVEPPIPEEVSEEVERVSLDNKRVLVVGANGRLGSMVCRHLLRNNPKTEVIACVHFVSEGMTSRGYGRLSYEVGAEDGAGSIGAAWSEERTATFEYADYMKDYNLQNIRLVECELLDPVQCKTICEGVDSVVWCATDFNGNAPRAVSSLDFGLLFRAVANPTKGRVEVEGLRNMLGALKLAKNDQRYKTGESSSGGLPHDFVLVSAAPNSFEDFETPFGTFHGLKREGEDILKKEFPSLSYTILQMCQYDDFLVEEGLDVLFVDNEDVKKLQQEAEEKVEKKEVPQSRKPRRINRRDAAKTASDALVDPDLTGKSVQVWTSAD